MTIFYTKYKCLPICPDLLLLQFFQNLFVIVLSHLSTEHITNVNLWWINSSLWIFVHVALTKIQLNLSSALQEIKEIQSKNISGSQWNVSAAHGFGGLFCHLNVSVSRTLNWSEANWTGRQIAPITDAGVIWAALHVTLVEQGLPLSIMTNQRIRISVMSLWKDSNGTWDTSQQEFNRLGTPLCQWKCYLKVGMKVLLLIISAL